ncbi:MAG: 3-deoxy-manno-octulosonate cytidylyltransferase [Bacteroidota bacterium]
MPLLSLGVIPARYASTRFPGKPLVMIDGKSMIMRVYEQAKKCAALNRVIVATDDKRIFDHVTELGGEVMMTADTHISGTSRLGEVVRALSDSGSEYDVIVNIQGDEPFIDPVQIDLAVSLFTNPEVQIGTLRALIKDPDDLFNPNVVKIVVDHEGKALYFSRSAIPYLRGVPRDTWLDHHDFYRHIGLYAYRASVLNPILGLPAAPPESAESLEQLRWLYHGFSIHTAVTDIETVGIDTPGDLLKLTNNA